MTDTQSSQPIPINRALERQRQQSQPSGALATTRLCELPAATRSQGISQLSACLTLVSPSGLTANDRKEWLAVAMRTLTGIPADLLERGCEAARLKCRFPSEIVPTIMETIGKSWEWRKQDARREEWGNDRYPPEPQIECVDPKAIRDLIKRIGT
jgi:hypothetical protein